MENKMTEKQWKFLGRLKSERYAPNLVAKYEAFLATDLSSKGASELIEQYLNSPKKSESLEYKAILAEEQRQIELSRQRIEDKRNAEEANCEVCKSGHPIPHFNCSFEGRVGHGRHCSADLCF